MKNRRDLTSVRWSEVKTEIRDILVDQAKAGQLITYSELTAMLQTAYIHYHSHILTRLLVEIGSDAASLKQAVQTGVNDDRDGIAQNVRLVVRNTYMDSLFICLYWLTYAGIAYLAGLLGQRLFASLAVICVSVAAVADLLENHAILVAMGVRNFTDPVAVDMDELQHECGIAALYDLHTNEKSTVWTGDPDEIARLMPRMLLDLQNRGQLAAGLSSYNPHRERILDTYKQIGTVIEAFDG